MDELRARPMDAEYRGWTQRPSLMTANTLFLQAAIARVLCGVAFSALRGRVSAALLYPGRVFIVYICAMALPVFLLLRDAPDMRHGMRLRPPSPGALGLAVLAGAAGAMAFANLGTLWQWAIERMGGRLSNPPAALGVGALALATLGAAVIPALCEELLFRGALLGAWERRGTGYALAVSSLLFAALHGSLEGLPVQLLAGLAAGYIAVCTGSVYVSIAYHAAHNLTLLYVSGAGSGANGLYYALSGEAGAALTVLQALAFGAALVLLLALIRRGNGGRFEQIARVDRAPMPWQELVVLISGATTVCAVLLIDILGICGVL